MTDPAVPEHILGIEGGGTHTVALLASSKGRLLQRVELGPANLRLTSDRQLKSLFGEIRRQTGGADAVGIGMAGVRTGQDRDRIRRLADQLWPGKICFVGHDLDTALAAAGQVRRASAPDVARVILASGTGSCCFGRNENGQTAKVGGWGHILGDKGSGYHLALQALQSIVSEWDRQGRWTTLGQRLLRALQLNDPEELITWVQSASKTEIARLAPEVFAARKQRDPIARQLLDETAVQLAADGVLCARRLVRQNEQVLFVLAGSVLLQQPRFQRQVAGLLKKSWPRCRVRPLDREPAWGAVFMAAPHLQLEAARAPAGAGDSRGKPLPCPIPLPDLAAVRLSPTEQRNARSMRLDQLPIEAAVKLMLDEEQCVRQALASHSRAIARVIRWITRSFRSGGRLFYVGAGTSGRLGVLDASECPPTFQSDPEQVQGIIAGGQRALWQAVEGAEDDADAGAKAIRTRGVQKEDLVVGIAASGRTPFVWGALHAAGRAGAKTVLLCFNPRLKPPAGNRPSLIIAPDLGPEILTGSTRLKSGTATKLILNMFTTLAMVQLGKVISNLMVDLHPSNEKLRDRAVRITCELTGSTAGEAVEALKLVDYSVKAAFEHLQSVRASHSRR